MRQLFLAAVLRFYCISFAYGGYSTESAPNRSLNALPTCPISGAAANTCTYQANSVPAKAVIVNCNTAGGATCAARCQYRCKFGYTWAVFAYEEKTSGKCDPGATIRKNADCSAAATALGHSTSVATTSSGPPGCYFDSSGNQLKMSTGTEDCSSTNTCLCIDRSAIRNPTCASNGGTFAFANNPCTRTPDGYTTCADPLFECPATKTRKLAAATIQCYPDAGTIAGACVKTQSTAATNCCDTSCQHFGDTYALPSGYQLKADASNIPCAGSACASYTTAGRDICCDPVGTYTCVRNVQKCHGNSFMYSKPASDSTFTNNMCGPDGRPFVHDVNADGYQDLVCGTKDGKIRYWQRNTDLTLTEKTGVDNPFDTIMAKLKEHLQQGDTSAFTCAGVDGSLDPLDQPACETSIWIVRWNSDNYDDVLLGSKNCGVLLMEGSASGFGTAQQLITECNSGSSTIKFTFPAAADFDGDNDIDLFVGSSDTNDNGQKGLRYYERDSMWSNTLVHRPSITAMLSITAPTAWALPFPVDLDGDDDLDIVVGGATTGRLLYLERLQNGQYLQRPDVQNPVFAARSVNAATVGLFSGDSCTVAKPGFFGDWNKDGIFDILIGDGNQIKVWYGQKDQLYTQRGGLASPFFGLNFAPDPQAMGGPTPHLVDWDGDNDLDLIVGVYNKVLLWTLNAEGNYEETNGPSDALVTRQMGGYAAPFAVDWDSDNDMDLIYGSRGASCVGYYERDSATRRRELTLRDCSSNDNPFKNQIPTSVTVGGNLQSMTYMYPKAIDWDGDGDLDIVIGMGTTWVGGGCIKLYLNNAGTFEIQDGTDDPFASFTCSAKASGANDCIQCYVVPWVVDHDGDGDLDVFVGHNSPVSAYGGQIAYHERIGANAFAPRTWWKLDGSQGDVIDVGDFAAPQVVQIDNTGQIDMLVGMDNDLRVFLRGWCEATEACSSKGVCNARKGTCVCSVGYSPFGYTPVAGTLPNRYDCSGCDKEYYGYPTQQDPSLCVQCPFDPAKGLICYDKGVCNDDFRALAALANDYSNTLRFYVKGNGNCSCSPLQTTNSVDQWGLPIYTDGGSTPFYGSISATQCLAGTTCTTTQHPLRLTCKDGQCPAGLELIASQASAPGPAKCFPCVPGRFKDIAGNGPYVTSESSCDNCVVGKYTTQYGQNDCATCPAGKHQGFAGGTRCETCDAGKYATGGSPVGVCTNCPAGKASGAEASSCTPCNANQYSAAKSPSCSDCLPGKYSAAESTVCSNCPSGRIRGASDSTCTDCAAGKYALDGKYCVDCAVGKVAPAGQATCDTCPEGKAANVGVCDDCPAGKYAPAESAKCIDCAIGKYSDTAVSRDCTLCPQGRKATTPGGRSSCDECGAGKFAPVGGTDCTACAYGKVATAGSGACASCLAGQKTNSDKSQCESCSTGQYSAFESETCTTCDAGKYSAANSPLCTDCAVGRFSGKGSASCQACTDGQYAAAGSANCLDCAAGKAASGAVSSCTTCNAGKFALAKQSTCSDCVAGRAAGVGKGVCEPCGAGEVAPATSSSCTPCQAGTRVSSGLDTCVPCASGTYAAQGDSQCSICAAGRSTGGQSSQASCTNCPAGFYAGAGASVCTGCPSGKYSTGVEQISDSTCVACAMGTYNNLTGKGAQADCLQCPTNSQTTGTASTYQAQCLCVPGYSYSATTSGFECSICPAGSYKAGSNHGQCSSCEAIKSGSSATAGSTSSNDCHCPPGRYSSLGECRDCPLGYYCPGTKSDDNRYACPNGATTESDKATSSSQCLCMKGYYLFESNCMQCIAGRYKETVSNGVSCPGDCTKFSVNATSAAGSRSNTSCICKPNHVDPTPNDGVLECQEAKAGTAATGSDSMTVPSVQSQITLNGVKIPKTSDDKLTVAQQLANKVVEMLGIDMTPACSFKTETATQDIFACGDIDVKLNKTSFTTSSRRLSGDALHASFTVRRSTQEAASAAASLFQPAQLASLLPTDGANGALFAGLSNVSTVDAPVAVHTVTTCPNNKAFPVGVAFVSVTTSCKCKAGYEPSGDGQTCSACRYDFWKSIAKDEACTKCPDNRKTLATGVDTQSKCYCKGGYYGDVNGICKECPANAYCPFDDDDNYVPCGTGKSTIGVGKQIFEDCMCKAGWGVVNVTQCGLCKSGSYKQNVDNAFCADCPQASRMQSELGSITVQACSCIKNYYYDYTRTSCESCHVPGIQCDGGFYTSGPPTILITVKVSNFNYSALTTYQYNGIVSMSQHALVEEMNNSIPFGNVEITLSQGSVVINAKIILAVGTNSAVVYANLIGSPTLLATWAKNLNNIVGLTTAVSFLSIPSSSHWNVKVSMNHVRPFALPGKFLTGVLRVSKCADNSAGTGSICLGGNESTRPCSKGCNCIEGMDGFVCQNCIRGWTRPDKTSNCRQCDDLGPAWWMILPLIGSAFCSAALYFILTALALAAGLSSKRVHTALLRMWQSWVLSMVVLKQFNLSDIGMFAWGEEKAKFAYLKENPQATPEETQSYMSGLSFVFPQWFKKAAEWLYGLSEFVPQIGKPAEILQCFAEKTMSEEAAENGKFYLVAIYWALYPLAIIIITYGLALLVVYVLFPPLDKRNLFPPSDPRIFKAWAFDRVRPMLEKSIRALGCADEDVECVLADMKALLGTQNLTFPQIQKLAENPIGGISAVSGRMDLTSKLLCRRIIVKIFKPKLITAAKKCFMKMASKLHHKKEVKEEEKHENEGEEGEKDSLKNPQQQMWLDPWPHRCGDLLSTLVENMPVDALCNGIKDPMGLMTSLVELAAGANIVPVILHPFFRLIALTNDHHMDLEQCDEVWEHVADFLGSVSLDTMLNADPIDFLDKLGEAFGGHIMSVFWGVKNKRKLLEEAQRQDPEVPEEQIKKQWMGTLTFIGTVDFFELQKMSYEEIIAAAAIHNKANDKQEDVIDMMRDELAELQDDAVLDTAEGVDLNADYCIFGIWHRDPSWRNFFIDSKPLLFISLYTMWYQVAKEGLSGINCDNYPVSSEAGDTEIQSRWAPHTDWQCFHNPHLLLGLTAMGGLAVWSFGFLLLLAFLVYRNRRQIAEPEVGRCYAYFVQGYEIEWCHWDVFVKRGDLLCTILISSTNIADDKKAKLLLYTALAATALIMHAAAKPFDNRKGELLDRYEFTGLMVRFMTFAVIELCLVFNPALWVTIVSIGIAAIFTAWYAASIWLTIVVEYIADLTSKGQKADADDVLNMIDEGTEGMQPSASPQAMVTGKFKKGFKWIAGILCKSVIVFCFKQMVKLTAYMQSIEKTAVSMHFGKNCELNIMCREENEELFVSRTPGKRKASAREKNSKAVVSSFFHQTDDAQREFLATVISAYYTHVICTMQLPKVPARSLECFLAMSAALKMARMDSQIGADASIDDKYKAIFTYVKLTVHLMFEQGRVDRERVSDKLKKTKTKEEMAKTKTLEAEKEKKKAEKAKKKSKSESSDEKSPEDKPEQPDIEGQENNKEPEAQHSNKTLLHIHMTTAKSDEDFDELTAQDLEKTLDSMRLSAEELNETLMVLYRVKMDQCKKLFSKVVQLFEDQTCEYVITKTKSLNNVTEAEAEDDTAPCPPSEHTGVAPKGVPRETPLMSTPSFQGC